jgi:uncharacterized SAM-binding protein YcdF (DUF218 family)
MNWLIRNALAAALLPPGSLIIVLLCGLVLARRRRLLGRSLIAFGLVALYALSTQYVADGLLQTLEPLPLDPATGTEAQAIVVLGGGTYFSAPEYGGTTSGSNALVRLRYAAYLQRKTGKPLLVSGGSPEGAEVGEARHMREILQREFQVPVKWVEDRSLTTLENARLSHAMLRAHGIRTVYVVTQAWHMPRARLAFEHAGFTVIPAATDYATRFRLTVLDFLPDARALRDSSLYFRELIGIGWYRLQFALAR